MKKMIIEICKKQFIEEYKSMLLIEDNFNQCDLVKEFIKDFDINTTDEINIKFINH